MASINLGWIGDWFHRPNKPSRSPNFAFIGGRYFGFGKSENLQNTGEDTNVETPKEDTQGFYSQLLDQFYWECENRPDYRHTPEVERILAEQKSEEPTPDIIKENPEMWEEFNKSPLVKFLKRAEVIADKYNEMELKENEHPYHREDRELWKELPYVPGLDGRPFPRKAIKTKEESDDKFWDFARQFFFGLWGFRQRPYPPGRPCDVAQAIGYKRLERRYYDCEFSLYGCNFHT